MQGRIIRIVSNRYTVEGQDKTPYIATAMGKLRLGLKPVVGDKVELEDIDGKMCIQKVYERTNELYRPAIANVDQAMIVMSAANPDFSNVLVDRLIFLISYFHIEPVIVISKMDLVEKDNVVYSYIDDYRKSGYKVILIGKDYDLTELKENLKGKVTVLAGQSGVGKSSLLNRLDPDFSLKTQEISKALGRGKHTTRHTELYEVAQGYLADTPGFSSLDFSRIDSMILANCLKDFENAGVCKFNDCHHINEPGCAVKQKVASGEISKYRYQNYLDVVPLCNTRKDWE